MDGQTLTTVLTQLQNSIDSLSGLGGSGGSVLDMPLGTVLPIATESVPEGWMLCDGREISIEEYQGLYDLIGTTYGAGDSAFWAQVFFPATTFNIPDLRGRTIIGANDMGGEQSEVIVNHPAQRGQSGGAEMHQLVQSELPVVSFPVLSFQSAGPDLIINGSTPVAETQIQFGADEPHNNMQPYMALNYMIKVGVSGDELANLEAEIESAENAIDSLAAHLNSAMSEIQEIKECWELPRGRFAILNELNGGICDYPSVNEFVIAVNSGCDVQSLELLFDSGEICGGSLYPELSVVDSIGQRVEVWFDGVFTDDPDLNLINSTFWALDASFPKAITIYIPPGTNWSQVLFKWQFWGAPCGGNQCFSDFTMKCIRH